MPNTSMSSFQKVSSKEGAHMRRYRNVLTASLAAVFVIGCFGKAQAIPAFSREHNTECTTCHTIYPELNEYGDAFLKNGFVWTKHQKDEPEAKAPAPAPKADVKGEGVPELLNKLRENALNGGEEQEQPVKGV